MDILSLDTLLLLIAAILAGALNAVAGGGTMFTFPVLMMTGVPAIVANATSKVGIWPGAAASVFAYRKELREYARYLPLLAPISLVGGWLGAELLLVTPQERFEFLVPWLLLLATVLFAFGRQIRFRLARFFCACSGLLTSAMRAAFAGSWQARSTDRASCSPLSQSPEPETWSLKPKILPTLFHLATSVYGGFFGAGIGILMLSMMEMLGLKNIHGMNGLKTVLGATMHTSAVLAFIVGGGVLWPQACVLVAGSIFGGYFGARLALKMPQHYVRWFVIGVGLSTSVYFFIF